MIVRKVVTAFAVQADEDFGVTHDGGHFRVKKGEWVIYCDEIVPFLVADVVGVVDAGWEISSEADPAREAELLAALKSGDM